MQGQGGGGAGEFQLPSGCRMWLPSEAKLGWKSSAGTTLYILQPPETIQVSMAFM